MRILGAVGALLVVLAVAGCGGGTTSPAPAESAAEPVDAAAVVDELVAAGVAAGPHSTTAESDPDQLLGRPNGYTSRATFTIPGVEASDDDVEGCDRGGCIEQWSDAGAAQDRADYIGEIGKRLPAAGEYSYPRDDGMLLRVSRAATPAKADELRAAFFGG